MVSMGSRLVQAWYAISAVIMLLDKGDHLILNSDVYGGTYRALTKVFTRFGVEVDFVDTTHIENVENTLSQKLKCYTLKHHQIHYYV